VCVVVKETAPVAVSLREAKPGVLALGIKGVQMSGTRKTPVPPSSTRKDSKDALNEMLNFCPEPTAPRSGDFAERIRQIVKKLQEINQRIDNLSTRS